MKTPILLPNPEIMLKILFEDEYLIAVYKPSGLKVHPLSPEEKNTLANALVATHPSVASVGAPLEGGLVHRLDNDTSGVMVGALTETVYHRLREQWNQRTVFKEYTALVVGLPPSRLTSSLPIAHHPSNAKKMTVCETPEKQKSLKGRPASTDIERIQAFRGPQGEYSLVSVRIQSGVRHQIRVHLAALGYPIAGDRLYQNPQKRSADRLGLKRHFLHLSRVELNHPESKRRLRLEAPLPEELDSVLKSLKKPGRITEL